MSRTDVLRPTPDVSARRSPRSDGVLILAGAGIFATLVVVLHYLENDFKPCCRYISEYVLGDWGWVMNLAFAALGVAFLGLAHGLRSTLMPGRRVTASIRLIYITAVTVLATAFFNSDSVADQQANVSTWHGTLHDLFGFLGFACVTVATFFLRGVFTRDPQWRRFAPHALLFAIVIVVMFAVTIFAPLDSFGVAQRVFVMVDVLWLGTLGCALLTAEPVVPSQPGDRAQIP